MGGLWPHVWFDEGDILTLQVRDGVPSRVTLLHSCGEVHAAIELLFRMVSGVTPVIHMLDGGPCASSGRGGFWGRLPHWPNGFSVVLIICDAI